MNKIIKILFILLFNVTILQVYADCSSPPKESVNWSGCNLQNRDLSGAKLREANLSGANLMEARLTWANLIGANLIGANLAEANLSDATWIDGTKCAKNSIGKCVPG